MAPFLFTDAISKDKPIKVFNQGKMQRDFTYIDDIVEGVIRIQNQIPIVNAADAKKEGSPLYRVYNIGNNQPVELEEFIDCIESALDKKAVKKYLPMQDGDVKRTFADVTTLESAVSYKPNTDLQVGINKLVSWYNGFYKEGQIK
jgi:UDP-glucuronate 4-epimerase